MMINNKRIDMDHLKEMYDDGCDGNTQAMKIAHYIIHNINHYHRLKNFLFIVQGWVNYRNLIEILEDIVFEIEFIQCNKIEKKIQEDFVKHIVKIIKCVL